MQLKYLKTLLDGQDLLTRVVAIAWSPNQQKLAVTTVDRHILLYDEAGERRDKFSTKPANAANGKHSYVIRDVAFSPDSTKLAVAQSDQIVYVYKLGESWDEKKIICHKFAQTAPVTRLIWLSTGAIIIGLENGKVRALHCKNNKSQSLYCSESICVSLAANTKGTAFISGHGDGTIIRYFMSNNARHEISGLVVQHIVPPFALAWSADGFCVGGCDRRIVFYDSAGRQTSSFDYTRLTDEREFTVAACSPNGQTVAFGSFGRIRTFTYSPRVSTWLESTTRDLCNSYTISNLLWRRDGARLVVASVTGSVLIFQSVLKRTIWQDKLELIYVAPSQLLVRSLHEPQEHLSIESKLGLEIDNVRIMGKENYLVARTEESLILCDMTRNLVSEVPWIDSGRHERFYFENPNVCLIFNVGELSLIEYGETSILGSVRTEFVNPHVISVRLNERAHAKNVKKMAYLLDVKTICILDLTTNMIIGQISHETKIDWLELTDMAHKLLFRDKKFRLTLYDVNSGKKQTLLLYVTFVQLVPLSDVVIAQSNNKLAIFYNIDIPEDVHLISIRGEAIEVQRDTGRTFVRTEEGPNEYTYDLDEGLVEFGTAVNDKDFGRAVHFLESLDNDNPAAKAIWHNLGVIAMENGNLRVAHRCFFALGNVSKVFYLMHTINNADLYEEQINTSGTVCPDVQANLALLKSDIRTAERIYLEQHVDGIEGILNTYRRLRMYEEAVLLARKRSFAQLQELKEEHLSFLLSSNQEEKAAQVLEEQGDIERAIQLYLKARKPARAAKLALKTPHILNDLLIMKQINEDLINYELYEVAGDIAYKLNRPESAISMYRKAFAFTRALDLARETAPEQVTQLEEELGDWLVARKQLDASITHYIEAGNTLKALDAAVGAKQWRKAVQIAKVLDEPKHIQRYALDLSKHLAFYGDIDSAEDLLVRAQLYKDAIKLLNRYGMWERAFVIGEKYLATTEMKELFLNLARQLEEQGKYREAEQILLAVNEPDLAIAMYRRRELFDAMIRLVERFHKNLLDSTHLHLARQLEARGKYKNAEKHFISCGDWKSAVHMYCSAGRMEDGYRVAKQWGTDGTRQQVAYMWAKSLPVESAVRLLSKLNLFDTALSFACDSGHFDFAMDLCRTAGKPAEEVHFKIAMSLEDEGKFDQAEEEFLKAKKPREAIHMYMHAGDWKSAINVAETHLPEAFNEVLFAQANAALETRNYVEYEAILLGAQRADVIIDHYKMKYMFEDALRIAMDHQPAAVNDLRRLQAQHVRQQTKMDENATDSSRVIASRDILERAAEFAKREDFRKAAECLMEINEMNAENASTEERALLRAAEICNQFLEQRDAIEVASVLGPRLQQIKQFAPAAQLYLAADMPKEAVDVFIKSEQWSKARRLAKEIDADLLAYVEKQQKLRLRYEGNIEQLADIDIVSALDMLADQGQWQRCIERAKEISMPLLQKYISLYAAQLLRDGECVEALNLYMQYGVEFIEVNFNIYIRIAMDCFGLREEQAIENQVWKNLRNFLFEFLKLLKANKNYAESVLFQNVDTYLLIAHYFATREACRKIQSLHPIAVRLSIALLRHSDVIPVDKCFFEAGMELRAAGREAEAFVMLNHYLDVCAAIEEGSEHLVDHSYFACTDFPSSVPLPQEVHLRQEPSKHEEIREYILAISMDQQVDQVLPTDDRGRYESSLREDDVACILSGYPVLGRQPVTFQNSKRQANRDVYSKCSVALKISSNSEIVDVLDFITKWNGKANFFV